VPFAPCRTAVTGDGFAEGALAAFFFPVIGGRLPFGFGLAFGLSLGLGFFRAIALTAAWRAARLRRG